MGKKEINGEVSTIGLKNECPEFPSSKECKECNNKDFADAMKNFNNSLIDTFK